MIKVGDKLIHPIHGEMIVISVDDCSDEYIDGKWRNGKVIVADFDRPIDCVRWRNNDGNARLVFHSYYLKKLRSLDDGY